MATELVACSVPEDPAFSASAEGYVVTFVALYERGFGAPSHQFLRSLLSHYCLELHNLTPSRVLHIAAFVTLCEAYKRTRSVLRRVSVYLRSETHLFL
jgi:hypothetical protein